MCQIWCARDEQTFSCSAMHCTYHHPAISLRDEPPQRLLARYVVKCDSAAPMLFSICIQKRWGGEGSGRPALRLVVWPSLRVAKQAGHAKSGSGNPGPKRPGEQASFSAAAAAAPAPKICENNTNRMAERIFNRIVESSAKWCRPVATPHAPQCPQQAI